MHDFESLWFSVTAKKGIIVKYSVIKLTCCETKRDCRLIFRGRNIAVFRRIDTDRGECLLEVFKLFYWSYPRFKNGSVNLDGRLVPSQKNRKRARNKPPFNKNSFQRRPEFLKFLSGLSEAGKIEIKSGRRTSIASLMRISTDFRTLLAEI